MRHFVTGQKQRQKLTQLPKNLNLSLITATIGILLSALAPLAHAQPSVSGRILDDGGKPVPSAVVYLQPQQQQQGDPGKGQKADTNPAGEFSAAGLADGVYNVCVHMPEKGYINACNWLKNPPTVTVKKGQAAINADVPVQTGVKVQVRVNDPGRNLQVLGPVARPPFLLVGVWSEKGFFYPMGRVGGSNSGDYEITVPYESNLNVTVNGTGLQVSLERGAAAEASKAGAAVPLRLTKGSAPRVLTLDVSAAAK